MTGDFPARVNAECVGEGRKLDRVQEIARWPEWGVERWEEDRAEFASHCLASTDHPEQQPDVPEKEAITRARPLFCASTVEAKSRPRYSVSRPALAMAALFLFLATCFYGFKVSWADMPPPSSAPLAERVTVNLESGPLPAADVPDGAAQVSTGTVKRPAQGVGRARPRGIQENEVSKASVIAAAAPQPVFVAKHLHPIGSSGVAGQAGQVKPPLSKPACVRVYPQLGRCHLEAGDVRAE